MGNCRRINPENGFAYVWLLAFVGVMAIMVTAVVEMDSTMQRREQELHLLAIGREFQEAIRHYHETLSPAGSHDFPARLQDLLLDSRGGQMRRHLRKIYVDPLTGKNEWGLKLEDSRIIGLYSLSPGKPIKQDGFTPEDQRLKGATSYREWVFEAM